MSSICPLFVSFVVTNEISVDGHFAAARELVTQLQFEQLSMSKSSSALGRAVDVMNLQHIADLPQTTQNVRQLRIMQDQSQAYFDMSQLVQAVDALVAWRTVEHEIATTEPRASAVMNKLRKTLKVLKTSMEPLLLGLLIEAKDGEFTCDKRMASSSANASQSKKRRLSRASEHSTSPTSSSRT